MTFSDDDDDDEDDNSDSELPEGGAPELESIDQDSGGWLTWAFNETLPFTSQEAEYRKSGTDLYSLSVPWLIPFFIFFLSLSCLPRYTLTFHITLHHTYQ